MMSQLFNCITVIDKCIFKYSIFKLNNREKEDTWCEEDKLEAHSNWIRDVVWAPSTDFGLGVIASCSQVIIYFWNRVNHLYSYTK